MIIKEVIQRIQSLYSKGVQSSDSRLSSRHIYHKLLTVRSKLLSDKANKKQRISDWNYQTLPCVELIEVPAEKCPCVIPSGCEVVRSKYKLPKPLLNLNTHIIKDVSSIDGNIKYSESTITEKRYKKNNKYSKSKPDYFIQDGYLYLTHLIGTPRIVTMVALFEDPIKANDFYQYCGDCVDCQPCTAAFDFDLPIDSEMVETIVEFSVKELIEFFNSRGEQDITSDSRDDAQPENNGK